MAKGSGSTRSSSMASGNTSKSPIIGGGSGSLKGNSFDNMKLSDFEGNAFVNGAYYSLSTKDGKYLMTVDMENGYNENRGADGTTITISMQNMQSSNSTEIIYNGFAIDNPQYKTPNSYVKSASESLERTLPYIKELADKYIKRNN